MNFIALAIISEFDDFFYSGLPKVEFTKLNNRLTIIKTSSSKCRDDEKAKIWIPEENPDDSDSEDEDKNERYIRMKPIVRACQIDEFMTK
eukprot:CAMPEP_0176395196 /NCGR_PEP_ID=MMETSP0126-20121128/43215_1 /TAXON_ID=141414 ORGANISM="Strombidinopsis acuminatum, Strain SPMC142" /NCGR_SAMPLE_ID=MMETSP0126 /ASSEMBLY_ACC=CAM_ASM_000229 /LENGTH=89 /DNA_ID=CAMNT_0017767929 /DNA_START=1804 /DNA_END=2073 /DNA_ORIENTATION=-